MSNSGADDLPSLRNDWLDRPARSRFAPEDPGFVDAMAAHAAAVAAGHGGYLDPRSGLFVMTATSLHDRGWCCQRGCRHCPYVEASGGSRERPDSDQSP